MILTLAFIALVLAQVADLVTTYLTLKAGGRELNPVMNKLAAVFGGNLFIPAIIGKIILIEIFYWLPFPEPITWAVAAVFFAVAGRNFLQYKKQLKINAKNK